ncbi:uncharacterized protein [Triticum aestivum]|uniref:uncharacterized protein n=1 Tax=Triticum aestivum TaxID=4565 RepID=UPI001D03038D|nr:uncharacterized protein LOC123171422 [Triticum aestivum]
MQRGEEHGFSSSSIPAMVHSFFSISFVPLPRRHLPTSTRRPWLSFQVDLLWGSLAAAVHHRPFPTRRCREVAATVVKDFDDAVKHLVDLLRTSNDRSTEGKLEVFVCYGWFEGVGASAVLRATAKLLNSTTCDDFNTRKHFDRVVYVDCSNCINRRAMQRAIAKELNLHHAMPIIDKQDEHDDFRGVHNSNRKEVPGIGSLITKSLRDERFLMIFYYEVVEDIDLIECGIPVFGKGILLWTNCRRFLVHTRESKLMSPSASNDIFISFYQNEGIKQIHNILHEEAVGVIGGTGMDGINPEIVLDCFLYSIFLTAQLPKNSIGVDYGWATHACNYWICDGILEDRAWEIGNALYGVIPQFDYYSEKIWGYFSDETRRLAMASDYYGRKKSYEGWCSVTSNKPTADDISYVPGSASSYFLTCQGDDPVYIHFVLLPQMIELMTNLRELNTKGVLWKAVSHAWKKLQKLHKLRLSESSDVVTVDICSFADMMNLELLDLSGNTHMESLPTLSSARSLKMLVIDGCSSLEHVALEGAPPLLESFSFDGYGPAENWTHSIHLPRKELRLKSRMAPVEIVKVTKISLHGCGRLQNIFLRALPCLEELDLSGTAIKILDLRAMDVPKLKKLFLLGCEQLRSLIWHGPPRLKVLHVDTQRKIRSMISCGEQGSFNIEVCIAFTDGRFIWSSSKGLFFQTLNILSKVYLLISCMSHSEANITKSIKEIGSSKQGLVPTRSLLPYNDIALANDVTCSVLVWNCRQLQTLNVHIEIGKGSYNLDSMQDEGDFRSFTGYVESLHVHDNCSITAIPPTNWGRLEWCHVERCPKLNYVFSRRKGTYSFQCIKIFSASDLLVAYCIWGGINKTWGDFYYSHQSLQQLQHIYLYNCPRLVLVLTISFTLPNLETLQIAYCSSLRHVFPLDDKYPTEIVSGVTFKNLKDIKLHHLHKLEQICEARLTAPALQTVGIRDCWALKRLPAVACDGPKPVVDCEKDMWDKLEWDGLDAGHHPSLFETRHSTYHKKTLPRGSYLRSVAC